MIRVVVVVFAVSVAVRFLESRFCLGLFSADEEY